MQTGLARLIARIVKFRRPVVVAIHAGLVALAYLAAFLIRFEFQLSAGDWEKIGHTIAFVVAVRLAIFAWFRLHEGLWRYVSVHDMVAIIRAVTIGSLIMSAGVLWFYRQDYPRSVLLLDWLLCIALVGGIRLGVRVFREAGRHPLGKGRRALIVGAGDAAEMLLREIERNPSLDFEVVGFVDDSQEKQRRRIHAIEVLGTIDQLPDLCEARQVREVLIAIPSATGEQMRRIIGLCRSAHVEFRTLPSVGELMEGGVALSQVRHGAGRRFTASGAHSDRSGEGGGVYPRQARLGDGCRRIDRLGTVPAARDVRAGDDRPAGSSGEWPVLRRHGVAGPASCVALGLDRGRRRGREAHGRGAPRAQTAGGVSRSGAQACAPDGGESERKP